MGLSFYLIKYQSEVTTHCERSHQSTKAAAAPLMQRSQR